MLGDFHWVWRSGIELGFQLREMLIDCREMGLHMLFRIHHRRRWVVAHHRDLSLMVFFHLVETAPHFGRRRSSRCSLPWGAADDGYIQLNEY